MNDKIYSYTKRSHVALGNLAKFLFWSTLSFKNWKLTLSLSQLSLVTVFLREWDKRFYAYSEPNRHSKKCELLFFPALICCICCYCYNANCQFSQQACTNIELHDTNSASWFWGKPNNFTLVNSLLLLLQDSSMQFRSDLTS